MARRLRIERAGGWYLVTARGNERRPIYREDADRRHFCRLLEEMVSRYQVRLHAYVLMDNHYHLLLEIAPRPAGVEAGGHRESNRALPVTRGSNEYRPIPGPADLGPGIELWKRSTSVAEPGR